MRYLFVWILFLGCSVGALSNDSIKRVLYVNSYHLGYPWADSVSAGIRSVLHQKNGIDLYVEYLDNQRFTDSSYREVFAAYLKRKYIDRIPDLFLASDDGAARLLLSIRPELGPDIPCVLCGINNKEYYAEFKNTYGLVETYPIDSTLGPLLKLFPDIERVVVISDNSPSSIIIRKEIEKQAVVFAGKPEFWFLPIFDPDSVLLAVQNLKKGDAVFVISMRVNKGISIDFSSYLRRLVAVCPVPVFCNSSDVEGTGIVGGRFTRGYTHGRDAAMLALRIVYKQNDTTGIYWENPLMEFVFDYKALKRFGYQVANLPKGSVILNKPVSFFSKYKKTILASGGITVVLLTIILVLAFNIIRRKRAEEIIAVQMEEIERKNRSLEETLTALKSSHKQIEIANKQLTELAISLEEAREKAEESDHLKSAFLANISHEIRTPLNAILGFSALLLKENANESLNSTYLSYIQRAGDALLNLIDKILLVARIESRQICPHKSSFPVKKLFEDLKTFIHSKFPEKENMLLFLPDSETISGMTIHSDRELLRTVLSELLDNACQFSESSEIRCIFESNSSENFSFSVEDNGIGIDEEKQKHLFHRFYKMESANKFHQGTGLGLFIAKSLVELLGGYISLTSVLGEGTTVSFTIPGAQAK